LRRCRDGPLRLADRLAQLLLEPRERCVVQLAAEQDAVATAIAALIYAVLDTSVAELGETLLI